MFRGGALVEPGGASLEADWGGGGGGWACEIYFQGAELPPPGPSPTTWRVYMNSV